jgi:hypothetical protein
MFVAALLAAAVARWFGTQIAALAPLPAAAIVATVYGAAYLGLAALLRLEEARTLARGAMHRLARKR